MVRPINTDIFILNQKSLPAGKEDLPAAMDLLDTLRANSERCVGMAANMIGVNRRIIAVDMGAAAVLMLNPVIVRKYGDTYEAEEGCLSHTGTKWTLRSQNVEVQFQDMNFKSHRQTFSGFTAQIIQHEIDHCDGILI